MYQDKLNDSKTKICRKKSFFQAEIIFIFRIENFLKNFGLYNGHKNSERCICVFARNPNLLPSSIFYYDFRENCEKCLPTLYLSLFVLPPFRSQCMWNGQHQRVMRWMISADIFTKISFRRLFLFAFLSILCDCRMRST